MLVLMESETLKPVLKVSNDNYPEFPEGIPSLRTIIAYFRTSKKKRIADTLKSICDISHNIIWADDEKLKESYKAELGSLIEKLSVMDFSCTLYRILI